jgi:hypothetical protein
MDFRRGWIPMRSPEDILEHLRKQSVKHQNDPCYRFTEMSKAIANPMLYEGIEEKALHRLLSKLDDETCKPHGSAFDKMVQEAAKSLLDAIFPPERKTALDAIAEAKQKLSRACWFSSGILNEPSRHSIMDQMSKRVCDPKFERLMFKLMKLEGFESTPLGQTLTRISRQGFDDAANQLAKGQSLGFVRCGQEFIMGGSTCHDVQEAISHLQEFIGRRPEKTEPSAAVSETGHFLSHDFKYSNGGLKALVPEKAVPQLLKNLDAAIITSNSWRGKRVDRLLGKSDEEILGFYNSSIESFFKFYSQAGNVSSVGKKLCRIMKMSFLHTMAASRNKTLKQVGKELRIGDTRMLGVTCGTLGGPCAMVLIQGIEGIKKTEFK